MAPGLSLAQAYVKHKQEGATELEAAQKASAALRQAAEERGRGRNISSLLFSNRGRDGDQLRTQLMSESDQPIKEFVQRHQAREDAMREALSEGSLQVADFKSKQLAAMMDPAHPANRAAQAAVKNAMPHLPDDVVSRLTVPSLDQVLPGLKGLGEYGKAGAEAGKVGAEAGKVQAETAQVAPGAAAERKLKGAEAGKVEAETLKTQSETGSEIAPGWVRGNQALTEPEKVEFRTKLGATKETTNTIDELLNIMGDKEFIANREKRAQAVGRVNSLLFQLKGKEGIRGMPQGDIAVLKSLYADPTALTGMNVLGLQKNHTALRTLRDITNKELELSAEAKGIRRAPAAGGNNGGAAVEKAAKGSPDKPAPPADMVRMKAPDGSTHKVARAKVAAAIAAGGKVL